MKKATKQRILIILAALGAIISGIVAMTDGDESTKPDFNQISESVGEAIESIRVEDDAFETAQ